jgi:hypothetical protein
VVPAQSGASVTTTAANQRVATVGPHPDTDGTEAPQTPQHRVAPVEPLQGPIQRVAPAKPLQEAPQRVASAAPPTTPVDSTSYSWVRAAARR